MGTDTFYTARSVVFGELAGVEMALADQFSVTCLVATAICKSYSGLYPIPHPLYCMGIPIQFIHGEI